MRRRRRRKRRRTRSRKKKKPFGSAVGPHEAMRKDLLDPETHTHVHPHISCFVRASRDCWLLGQSSSTERYSSRGRLLCGSYVS